MLCQEQINLFIRRLFKGSISLFGAFYRMRLPQRPVHRRILLALCLFAIALVLLRRPGEKPEPIEQKLSVEAHRFEIRQTTSLGANCSGSRDLPLAAVCADTICGEEFLAKFAPHQQQPAVPAIRHILWKSELVSKYFIRELKTWQRIHPNWTFVLWRDSDLEPFVRMHFPGKIYQKFKSLPTTGLLRIERVDMVRYMLLYKFGGVYADLDYTLVSSLDSYRRYPAVVTREPEAHAVQFFGLKTWPLPIVANPAFFMAAPGHPFFIYALHELVEKDASVILEFAGPFGLSRMLSTYYKMQMVMAHPVGFVYIPPSYSFYQYGANRLDTAGSEYTQERIETMRKQCRDAVDSVVLQVQNYCIDVLNLDPITDRSQPLVAIHDMQKKRSVYVDENIDEFAAQLQNVTQHINDLMLGTAFT